MTLNVALVLRADSSQFRSELGGTGDQLRDLGGDARVAGAAIAAGLDQGAKKALGVLASLRANTASALASLRSNARYGLSQLGNQVADIATQISGGISPLRAFVTQAPQIAGAFGPIGVAIGGVVAVAGGLAAAFFEAGDGMSAAERAAGSFKTAMDGVADVVGKGVVEADKLTRQYGGLSEAMRRLEALRLARESREATQALRDQGEAVRELLDDLEAAAAARLGAGLGELTLDAGLGELTLDQAEALQATLAAFRSGAGDVGALAEQLQQITGDSGALQALTDKTVDSALATAELNKQLEHLGAAKSALDALASEGGASLAQMRGDLSAVEAAVGLTTRSFEQMYQDVVGNSYVPDMVTESSTWFDRLRDDMTTKTEDATGAVGNAFRGLNHSVSSGLGNMIARNKLALADFADFSQDILAQVLSGLISVGLNAGFSSLFSTSAAGVAAGASGSQQAMPQVLHAGGIVGALSNPTRRAPLDLWAHADRYHGGGTVLRPGEVPIIAQRGERVLPAGAAGGGQVVNIIDQRQAGSPASRNPAPAWFFRREAGARRSDP